MKRLIVTIAAAALVSLGIAGGAAAASEPPFECPICDVGDYDGPLSEAEVEGLLLALNDEYHAWAIYDQVNKGFGDPRPFSNIERSETQHISRLVGLLKTYEVPVPENPWEGNVTQFDSARESAAAAVAAEVDNVALYDRIFSSTEREDILRVYENLQRASQDNHLPAFERAAGTSTTAGGGRGPRFSR